jgi:hypothetical protein
LQHHSQRENKPQKHTSRHASLRTRMLSSSVVRGKLTSGRYIPGWQNAAVQPGRPRYDRVLVSAGRRTERPKILGLVGRDDLACPLLARWALDCVYRHGILRACARPRIDLHRRRNLRSTVPRAGPTETGDQPRQLSSVAQGWTGGRVPG